MADVYTPERESKIMAAVRSKGNKATEQKLLSIMRAHRIRGWRRHTPLPGKPGAQGQGLLLPLRLRRSRRPHRWPQDAADTAWRTAMVVALLQAYRVK